MEGVRNSSPQGNAPRRLQQPAEESVLISYAESARHMVPALASRLEKNGVQVLQDIKLTDPASSLSAERLERIARPDALIIVLSARCKIHDWLAQESEAAFKAGTPVVVLLETPQVKWPVPVVPTLLTHELERVASFMERSRVDTLSIWEFAVNFFTDRATSRLFHRASSTAWRWERSDVDMEAGEFSLALMEDSASGLPQLRLVEARVKEGQTLLYLGSSDWTRYRLAWSAEIRAVIPAPLWPGAPAIGFMHCDFDSGREWARVGDPPVEIRLLGREIYGWHMSEYFWKAFVGSLPQMLGPAKGL